MSGQYAAPAFRQATTWTGATRLGRFTGAELRAGEFVAGHYRIAGNVYITGTPAVPVSRKVRLLRLDSARLVRQVWSDPATGAYLFDWLPAGVYTVLSHDHTAAYNAVVRDAIVAEPRPA